MGLKQEHRESQPAQLAGGPSCHQADGRAFREDSEQSINAERSGEQERRVMKQHGEVQTQGKSRHPAGRVFPESFIQKVQSAGQECEHQSVLPHFRRK